jgi:isoamylase/glycogen operon protein
MHVRGFTQGRQAESPHAGSFLGIIEQIPYLTSLGVNAIELLPIFEFHEQEYTGPEGFEGGPLCNYWGYSPVSFFAPMARYASPASPLNPIEQFKLMVRELHKAEIEVILDVVYNHTAEGHKGLESYCYRAWDADSFYIRDSEGHDLNYTGVGNTFNCNHPVAMELILDSLRYWVSEMHVDGFRFDLASIMMRDLDGTPLDTPPLVQAITKDPILAKCKLIAEPWDAAGLYHVGGFFSHSSRWSEWNGKYRDCVRRFLKGNPGMAGEFAKRLCGSEDLYGHNRTPAHSINFITAHDGFSLSDLVRYTHKHNLANGEENRDGSNMNDSWNCGAEGVSSDPKVLELRARQVRNFHLALMLSQGVPMIQMGDEYGHSKRGNNNTWCQDNYLSWFDWDAMDAEHGFQRFFRGLIQFRQRSPILRRREFLGPEDICWHGIETNSPAWDPQARLVAFTLYDHDTGHDLYAAFNAHPTAINVHLPARTDRAWHRLVDTSLKSPMDFQAPETAPVYQDESYEIPPFGSVLLRAQ